MSTSIKKLYIKLIYTTPKNPKFFASYNRYNFKNKPHYIYRQIKTHTLLSLYCILKLITFNKIYIINSNFSYYKFINKHYPIHPTFSLSQLLLKMYPIETRLDKLHPNLSNK